MTTEQAEFIAEALLALTERTPDRPFYSEESMLGKIRLARKREPLYGHLLAGRNHDPLLQDECRDVFEMASLSDRQSEVLWMRLEGWTFEEIGRAGGHSKQGAQSIFVQALRKLSRAFRVYPYRGMSDVYRFELKRGRLARGFGTIPSPAR